MAEIKNRVLYKKLKAEGITGVILCKGKGYFYIASNQEQMALRISRSDGNMIYLNAFNQQSIESWIKDIKEILQ